MSEVIIVTLGSTETLENIESWDVLMENSLSVQGIFCSLYGAHCWGALAEIPGAPIKAQFERNSGTC
jgi:hypothetical protein